MDKSKFSLYYTRGLLVAGSIAVCASMYILGYAGGRQSKGIENEIASNKAAIAAMQRETQSDLEAKIEPPKPVVDEVKPVETKVEEPAPVAANVEGPKPDKNYKKTRSTTHKEKKYKHPWDCTLYIGMRNQVACDTNGDKRADFAVYQKQFKCKVESTGRTCKVAGHGENSANFEVRLENHPYKYNDHPLIKNSGGSTGDDEGYTSDIASWRVPRD